MKAIFSYRAYAAVMAETAEKITTETGGLFLGTIEEDTWYIVEAIDPGPASVFEVAYFEYDQKYTEHLINKIANLYGHRLDLIGLWHRHPGSFDQFSSTDDGTNIKYASMREEGAISGLVNIDPEFRFTMYHVDHECRYEKIDYEVGDDLIPKAYLEYRTPDDFCALMHQRLLVGSGNATRQRAISLDEFMSFIEPCLQGATHESPADGTSFCGASAQERIVDAIVDDLSFISDVLKIEVTVSMQEECLVVSQAIDGSSTALYFADVKDEDYIALVYQGNYYEYHNGMLEAAFQEAKATRKARRRQLAQEQQRPLNVLDIFKQAIQISRGGGIR